MAFEDSAYLIRAHLLPSRALAHDDAPLALVRSAPKRFPLPKILFNQDSSIHLKLSHCRIINFAPLTNHFAYHQHHWKGKRRGLTFDFSLFWLVQEIERKIGDKKYIDREGRETEMDFLLPSSASIFDRMR